MANGCGGEVTLGQATLTPQYGVLSTSATETFQIGVTVFPTDRSDARTVSSPAGTSVVVYDGGMTLTIAGFPQDIEDACTLTVTAYEPWNPSASGDYYTYQWSGGYSSNGASCSFSAVGSGIDGTLPEALESGYVTVTDPSGANAYAVGFGWRGLTTSAPPDEPTVSIQETDTGGMVFEGDAATFDIHVDAGTSEPTSPLTVDYRTMDGSARPRRIINRPTGRCR